MAGMRAALSQMQAGVGLLVGSARAFGEGCAREAPLVGRRRVRAPPGRTLLARPQVRLRARCAAAQAVLAGALGGVARPTSSVRAFAP
jgi:hypothetical protein